MKSKIVILMLAALILTGCGEEYNARQDMQIESDGGYFTVIQQWTNNFATYRIVYANDTKVKYLMVAFNGISITPLYNADGSLQVYEGE